MGVIQVQKRNRKVLENLPARLRGAREAGGWTKAELSRQSGIHYDTLVKLEAGARGATLSTLVDLADAMGLDVAELVQER